MSNTKIKSFLSLPPFSDDESKKSIPVKDTVSKYSSRVPQSAISPVPTPIGRLTPAPERLTPTGQGRIKIPLVCMASSLKEEASNILDFYVLGVCFSPREAELCAEKAFVLDGNLDKGNHARNNVDEMPLNIGKYLGLLSKSSAESTPSTLDGNKASSSSIVSALSCGQSATCDEATSVTSVAVKNELSLNSSVVLENDDLVGNGGDVSVAVEQARFGSRHGEKTETREIEQKSIAQFSPRTASLSTFASNLVKVKSSRQGRSLQRWLLHSPTGELVRQVAGTIPITRDGRVVLISASRKKEWILPKGGWDADETKEECAMRESYEEGGIVGLLGGCMDPIDYMSAKVKKRVLEDLGDSDVEVKESGDVEGRMSNCPPLPKRFKTELPSLPNDHKLISSSAKRIVSSDSTRSTSSSGFNAVTEMTPAVASTVACGTKGCPYIRLFLFPLYVSSVKSEWPEKGRLRKLVHIDEAIRIMDAQNRPYFRMGLETVKERGLHLLMKSEQSDVNVMHN